MCNSYGTWLIFLNKIKLTALSLKPLISHKGIIHKYPALHPWENISNGFLMHSDLKCSKWNPEVKRDYWCAWTSSRDQGKEKKNIIIYAIFDSHQGFCSFYLPAFVNTVSTSQQLADLPKHSCNSGSKSLIGSVCSEGVCKCCFSLWT